MEAHQIRIKVNQLTNQMLWWNVLQAINDVTVKLINTALK